MLDIKQLLDNIKSKQMLHQHLVEEIQQKEQEQHKLILDNESLNTKLELVHNTLIAVKLILEKITHENKARLELFVTEALQRIFTDKNYAIELEVRDDTKRPAINILLVENGVKQDIRDSVGGGIVTTLGLLFQIYYLEVYELNKIIFIDEGLKEVSKTNLNETSVNYLNNLLLFLKDLSRERQYKIVVVTHDDSVKDIADVVYQVKDGEVNILRT